jgi:hypothetical protein
MPDQLRCALCHCNRGDIHPKTGDRIENLIINEEKTTVVCFDCITLAAEIMEKGKMITAE